MLHADHVLLSLSCYHKWPSDCSRSITRFSRAVQMRAQSSKWRWPQRTRLKVSICLTFSGSSIGFRQHQNCSSLITLSLVSPLDRTHHLLQVLQYNHQNRLRSRLATCQVCAQWSYNLLETHCEIHQLKFINQEVRLVWASMVLSFDLLSYNDRDQPSVWTSRTVTVNSNSGLKSGFSLYFLVTSGIDQHGCQR